LNELLGFRLVREREHIAMLRQNPDGTTTPLTMPNHPKIKGSTLRTIYQVFLVLLFCKLINKHNSLRAGSDDVDTRAIASIIG
jgi:hypothetical protein